jgi:hypothetical protein
MIVHNGILYRQWEDVEGGGRDRHLQLVVPRSLVDAVLTEIHNAPAGGHLGVAKTLDKARKRFYWIGQRKDVEEWCRSCEICASRKPPPKHRHAPLQMDISGGFRVVPRVPWNPLWAGPSTKKYYTDTSDRLKWNPPSLATQLRKLLWLTSACFSRKFVRKQVDWTGSFSQKRSKWAWFNAKLGVASKILRAMVIS